jgi:hypothetical protein
MISSTTKSKLKKAIKNPSEYCSGVKRKKFLVTYDKLLDEISQALFEEPCTNRMTLRQKVNSTSSSSPAVKAMKNMLKNQELIYGKDYRDHSEEIEKFLINDLFHFLKEIDGE